MKKLFLLLFLPLLVLTNYAYGYTDKYYGDGSGGSSEGLGIIFIIIVVIGLLFGIYIFIESFIKDRDFRKSVLDKSKEEVIGLAKGLPSLPKEIAKETIDDIKTNFTLENILLTIFYMIGGFVILMLMVFISTLL